MSEDTVAYDAAYKFPLCDYRGTPRQYLIAEPIALASLEESELPSLAHHILVLDRSGSMYYDIEALRTTVVKVLSLDDYNNPNLLVTVLSYSSEGDLQVHAERTPVSQMMESMSSPEVKSILDMRVSGLTCISQALDKASTYLEATEVTCITLHSDGYANHRSAREERMNIDRWISTLEGFNNVFVNTIAYSRYADFQLLAHIANSMSGRCIQATNAKDVYDALHDTQHLLDNGIAPALQICIEDSDYLVYVDLSQNKVIGSTSDVVIRGIAPDAVVMAWRYSVVSKDEFDASTALDCGDNDVSNRPILALCDAAISLGSINLAKFAMVSTRLERLIEMHMRSLTSTDLGHMQADVRTRLCNVFGTIEPVLATYGVPNADKPSIVDIFALLNEHAHDVIVDVDHLQRWYVRRGVKRIPGTRQEDGTVLEPDVISRRKPRDANDGDCQMIRAEYNNKNATLNVLLSQPMELIDLSGRVTGEEGAVIDEIAGITLTDRLYAHNNYTIVGDGQLNLPELRIRTSSFKLHRKLAKLDVWEEDDFVPELYGVLKLSDFPVFDLEAVSTPPNIGELFGKVARLKTLSTLFSAAIGKKSSDYTPEQISELRSVHLTPGLNFSPPTTTSYADKDEAIATGKVDYRVSYQIDIGSHEILHTGQLRSGNELLRRFMRVTLNGEDVDKPTMDMVWDEGVDLFVKTLSKRTKITAVDNLMSPILMGLLLAPTDALNESLALCMSETEVKGLYSVLFNSNVDPYDRLEALEAAKAAASAAVDACYAEIRPLVYYIGSTGLIPDTFVDENGNPPLAMSADDLKKAYPDLKIGKNEKEGTFYDVLGGILSIYAKNVLVSR